VTNNDLRDGTDAWSGDEDDIRFSREFLWLFSEPNETFRCESIGLHQICPAQNPVPQDENFRRTSIY
jgi:hypothetical protein